MSTNTTASAGSAGQNQQSPPQSQQSQNTSNHQGFAAGPQIETDDQKDIPRDVRLLHLLLASQSIHQYEDQVPLQLMDFAHRYTTSVLKDAIVYSDYAEHANPNASNTNGGSGGSTANNNSNHSPTLTVEDIRLAIAARTQYQFKPTAPKELLLQLAADRNKKALPQVMGTWGVRLPPEKYCLTAKEWELDSDKTKSTT
ncbi:hypothetical protein TBLA_0B03340 [Henningerozyma blattae CBS 6284]|uniref:Transcription initiation factor TFIID subunit 9 n=1 Tax=Henningerozyma blattae (strain ATCC 34711 / CBS 6284 / DSM 70876 / NBRC 10599 / NRRL Y-10934 / UCD 77-7) TaxID=1071380 RepID=I2GYH3_HENB6|nr:hypothetical protein TBLA_0B03340 [Tetrapisispora blattae CBS 6284]CCH59175.1 hypothetical protein TBLA_0B03340 [Tetrapisispora blattae CBS 6284]